jgi:hypothetical protein
MRTLGLALASLLLAAAPARADRCRAHCADVARVCKDRCKLRNNDNWDKRHQCVEKCVLREHECRSRC